jgi:hypothetical protein
MVHIGLVLTLAPPALADDSAPVAGRAADAASESAAAAPAPDPAGAPQTDGSAPPQTDGSAPPPERPPGEPGGTTDPCAGASCPPEPGDGAPVEEPAPPSTPPPAEPPCIGSATGAAAVCSAPSPDPDPAGEALPAGNEASPPANRPPQGVPAREHQDPSSASAAPRAHAPAPPPLMAPATVSHGETGVELRPDRTTRGRPTHRARSGRPGAPLERTAGTATAPGSATVPWPLAAPYARTGTAGAAEERSGRAASRAGSDRAVREPNDQPEPQAPAPPAPTQHTAVTAGTASAAAPPALWCLPLSLAICPVHELRRFGAQARVPVAPGVPLLRDRPG